MAPTFAANQFGVAGAEPREIVVSGRGVLPNQTICPSPQRPGKRAHAVVAGSTGITSIGVTPGRPAGPDACAVPIRSTIWSWATRMSVASFAFATSPRPLVRHSEKRVCATELVNQFACEPSAT